MNQVDTKKVGVLTLPLNANFGGMLQAVALYGFLAEHGFEVVHLRNEYFRIQWRTIFRKLLEKIPGQNIRNARYEYLQIKLHDSFLIKYLPHRTQALRSIADFKKVAQEEKFAAIIVGSDQVWRWDYIIDGYDRYFLNFIEDSRTRKIAYAASFGKPYWQADDKKAEVIEFLSDFHAVSTRESDGVEICHAFGRKECQQVLDPTLLVGKEFYHQILVKTQPKSNKKKLLTYLLDEQGAKLKFINHIQKELGGEYVMQSLGLESSKTVPEWVTAFHDADYVITDSFHGMAFCLLFNKQFIVIGNSHRGVSRFTSLLQQLELLDRLVDENKLEINLAKDLVKSKIDYKEIESKLKALRDISSDFLINSLN